MKLLVRIADLAATAVRAWLIVGILLRVTRVRDRFDGLALVFYTTPWPVIAAAFLLLAFHFKLRGNRHAVRRYAAFAVGALFTWVATSWHSTPPSGDSPDLRFIHWNVAHADRLRPRCVNWLREQQPDIICLTETRAVVGKPADRWSPEFPGYASQLGPGSLLCLVRGEVLSCEQGSLAVGSFYALHRLRVRGREVNVLQADLYARPVQSRRPPLVRLGEIARRYADGNLIIAGDFNTPRESAHFDPLRADFSNAFEAGGRGLAETWPIPALALSLDQVWLGRRWRAVDCVQPWTVISDHRPVIVTIADRQPGRPSFRTRQVE